MTLSDLRQTTATLVGMCENVSRGGHDEQLIENLRSDPLARHLPTGFGPEAANWIEAVITAGAAFMNDVRSGKGLHSYYARLNDLQYALDRLIVAVNAVKP